MTRARNEEMRLIRRAQKGDRDAVSAVVKRNMGMVHRHARKYKNVFASTDDYVQAGLEGVLRAIESFDTTRGIAFMTYAMFWVRAYASRAHGQPVRFERARKRVYAAESALFAEGVEPTPDAVMKRAKVDTATYTAVKVKYHPITRPFRDEHRVGGDGDIEEEYLPHPSESVEDRLVRESAVTEAAAEIRVGLEALPPRSRDIMRRFMGGENLQRIGLRLGLSRERVRQIKEEASERMRRAITAARAEAV